MYFFVIHFTGYQYDYVFDWTVLKYPQIGANTRSRVCLSSFAIMFFFFFPVKLASSYLSGE